MVFVGEHQKNIPLQLAEALQKLGEKGTYIRINSLFQKTLEEQEVTRIIQELQKRKLITIDQENVSYKLPASIE